MVYRYDYDVKNNLIDLLETKQDFAGVLEMPYYLEQYHQETSTARQNLQRFLSFLIIYFSLGAMYKCPTCKKRFALKRIGKELASSERISILQEVKTRNRNGNVVGTQEQYIPGTRRIYEIHYVCKNCGEDCYRRYEKETPNI